jgi:hypothetical protein
MPDGGKIKPLGALSAALTQMRSAFYQAPPDTIRGIDPSRWPSPLQPVAPVGPKDAEPLAFPLLGGQNLLFTPRFDMNFDASKLRDLSQYDLVRVIIENVKDQIADTPIAFQLRSLPGESAKDRVARERKDDRLLKIARFFERPDGEHDWSEWVRPIIEDMLVGDWASILVRRTSNQREIAELRYVPGHTICRYVDQNGWTPQPPSPAYGQNWFNVPYVQLTTKQLLYSPRNIVPRNTEASYLYGYSPTEQAATWIMVGAQRLKFQLMYYTEGAVPGVIHVAPQGMKPEKIAEAMRWMNSQVAGDLAARQQWRVIQGFMADPKQENIIFTKEKLLTDPFDDLVIRCLCFTFGTSPQRLMRMMNRASAEESQEAAEKEGYLPFLTWLRRAIINKLIQSPLYFNLPDYECNFNWQREMDVVAQMNAAKGYVSAGIYTRNEMRVNNGDDPRDESEADELMVDTPNGPVPLRGAGDFAETQREKANEAPVPTGAGATGKPPGTSVSATPPAVAPKTRAGGAAAAPKTVIIQRINGDMKEGVYTHPAYGDLANYKSFFAYDPKTNTALVKGDIDCDAALRELRQRFPERFAKNYISQEYSELVDSGDVTEYTSRQEIVRMMQDALPDADHKEIEQFVEQARGVRI